MATAKKKSKKTAANATPHCYPMTAEQKKREADWQAESDARTLLQAKEIRNDKARLSKAKAWAQKQITALNEATK